MLQVNQYLAIVIALTRAPQLCCLEHSCKLSIKLETVEFSLNTSAVFVESFV